jgi:hypothetical protein
MIRQNISPRINRKLVWIIGGIALLLILLIEPMRSFQYDGDPPSKIQYVCIVDLSDMFWDDLDPDFHILGIELISWACLLAIGVHITRTRNE